jgi:NAD(P)H dehydrogenase (quinone)
MVTFGAAIREGFLAIRSDDVEKLTGRPPRSVRSLIEAHADMLRAAAQPMEHAK